MVKETKVKMSNQKMSFQQVASNLVATVRIAQAILEMKPAKSWAEA